MMQSKKKILLFGICILLILHGCVQIYLSLHENQTIDEGVHLVAGYSYLRTGDFRLNAEHPPLAKMLAAFPLLFTDIQLPLDHASWQDGNQWEFARVTLYESGNNPDLMLLLGRIPMILCTVLLGAGIAKWGFDFAGWKGSYTATVLFATSPLFLAHGHLVTTDVPVSLGALAALYFFWRSLHSPKNKWILGIAVSVAFASLVKFTGLILFLAIPILYWIAYKTIRPRPLHISAKHLSHILLFSFACVFLAAFAFSNGAIQKFSSDPFYGSHHIAKAEETKALLSEKSTAVIDGYLWFLRSIPMPAYHYVTGFVEFASHYEAGHDSFFMGSYSIKGSPWYFPMAFLLKTRFGIVILLSLVLALFVKRILSSKKLVQPQEKKHNWINAFFSSTGAEYIFVIFPVIFMLISMKSHVNIGARHILPIYPFLFILIGILWKFQSQTKKIFFGVLTSILVITSLSGFIVFPFPMAYFSEISGGAKQGHKYLLDSNIDWGQNLKYLSHYLKKNNIPYVCYSYFGKGDFTHEGIDGRYLPSTQEIAEGAQVDCVVAISVSSLFGPDDRYLWLQQLQPTTIIGYSFYVFDLRK